MAKVIEVVQYEANDGSRFNSAAEADAHDFKLENSAKIDLISDAYLNTIGAIDRSRNMQKNTIEAFLAFHLPRVAAGTDLEPVERTVFDTPKADKAPEAETEAAAEAEAEVPAGEPVF